MSMKFVLMFRLPHARGPSKLHRIRSTVRGTFVLSSKQRYFPLKLNLWIWVAVSPSLLHACALRPLGITRERETDDRGISGIYHGFSGASTSPNQSVHDYLLFSGHINHGLSIKLQRRVQIKGFCIRQRAVAACTLLVLLWLGAFCGRAHMHVCAV